MLKNNKNILILTLLSVLIVFSGYYFWSSNDTNSPVNIEQQPTDNDNQASKFDLNQEDSNDDQEDSDDYIEETIIKNVNGTGLSKEVLRLALKAYYNAANEGEIDNHKLTIIDYSMPSNKKRMWLIDMDKKTVDLTTYVSHGVRSGDKIAKDFSNQISSHKTSIGVMKTGRTYRGHSGLSLQLHGLEKDFNSNVFKRHVVIHGTKYVSDNIARARGKIGKSFGCPAVDYKVHKQLINKIANGSLVFAYYPMKSWLQKSEYLM